MQNWKIINDDYLNYLRKFEIRIPKTDYGNNKIKPFFGELMTIGDIVYVTQVSSPKERHKKLKQALDFYKLYNDNNFIAVVNLILPSISNRTNLPSINSACLRHRPHHTTVCFRPLP